MTKKNIKLHGKIKMAFHIYIQLYRKDPWKKYITRYKKYLVLYGEPFIALYDNNNKLVKSVFGWKYTMVLDFKTKATSELKEADIIYKSENIVDLFNKT
jgi:hypothetical protein